MPNPVELYQAAVETTRGIIANVKPDQMESTTPCSEWNVGGLVEHMMNNRTCFSASHCVAHSFT